MIPKIGKLDRASFDRVIFPRLGKADESVLLGVPSLAEQVRGEE